MNGSVTRGTLRRHAAAKNLLCVTVFVWCWSGATATLAASQGSQPRGLYSQDGRLLKDDKPYRAIGANYFDLFIRILHDPADRSYQKGLADLSQAGVPFVRFAACGFWPKDYDLYLDDKEDYFRRLDCVVRQAEKHEIGLIPSLFWYYAAVPDVVGEPINQWGNPQSKTIALMKRYTREVVTRYRNSPAIWGWEMGNEYNLHVDLPNAASHRPKIVPQLKTASTRDGRDDLTSQAMVTALREFAKTVRKHDEARIIISGNSVPRPSAYHNTIERSWKRDNDAQFGEILGRDNPGQLDTISVHVYPRAAGDYPADAASPMQLIAAANRHARRIGKPLFLGEFGVAAESGTGSSGTGRSAEVFRQCIVAIEELEVPLAAFWVFDYKRQDGQWNVTVKNDRAFMLELVGEANARIRKLD